MPTSSTHPHPHPHPDLTYPLLPDAEQDLPIGHSSSSSSSSRGIRSILPDGRGANLHSPQQMDEYQWPESGPSSSPIITNADVDTETEGEPRVGPFGAKAVAAMTGAMATSLLMTPFDVLKTRLQTVQPRPVVATKPSIAPSAISGAGAGAIPGTDCCQTTMLTSTSSSSRLPPSSSHNPLTCLNSAPVIEPTSRQNISLTSIRPSLSPASAPSGCLYPSKWSGIWGEAITFEQALARGVIGTAQVYPSAAGAGGGALLVFPSSQAAAAAAAPTVQETGRAMTSGFWNEIAAVRRETGVKGLWKGVGTAITMGIPSSAIYMLGYEHLLTIISPYFTGTTISTNTSINADPTATPVLSTTTISKSLTPAPLIAGSMARTLSATVISPIEMFRTRLQALPSVDRGSPTYASTAKDMSSLVQSKGITILWRGLGPTLWRDVPFSGLYWASFELIKSYLHSSSSPLPPLTPITTSFISGFISGTFAGILTQPFDVLKTRRQVFNPSPECASPRAATIPLALHVIRTEGAGALFAGLSARVGKVAPACGLMIACYEGVGRWLGGKEGGKRAL